MSAGIHRTLHLAARAAVALGAAMAALIGSSVSAPLAAALPSTPSLTIAPGPTGHLYANGTAVAISVGPNSMFAPNSRIEVIECAAPDGTLPVDDTTCDGNTAQYGSIIVGTDGSFRLSGYTLYSLPNTALGETADGMPVCNATSECVLYVGENQNDFDQPKVFSAPFTIQPSAGSTPAPVRGPASGAATASDSGTASGAATASGSDTASGAATASGSGAGSPGAGSAGAEAKPNAAPGSAASAGAPTAGSTGHTRDPSAHGSAATASHNPSGAGLVFSGSSALEWIVALGAFLIVAGFVGSRRRKRLAG